MYPDSVQAVFGFFDARAQLVGGDLNGAAQTVRQVIPRARPDAFASLDYGSETSAEVMTGVSALAYHGDLDGAARVIRLSRNITLAVDQAVDSVQLAVRAESWELERLAQLFSGTGAAPARLRAVWNRGAELARGARTEERAYRARAVASAALGVFLSRDSDSTLLHELREITGRPLPRSVEGLVALRQGDSARARSLLATITDSVSENGPKGMYQSGYGWGDLRPLAAEAYYELGDYSRVVEILRDFEPGEFGTRGFDPRWAVLPRVRLLRGAALEQLGQRTLAAAQYRAVVEQWSGADSELLSVVQQARAGLSRLEGSRG
jgi:hypothetical protein